MNYDVIIVGAGASGLIAAIAAARQGSTVLLIEQKEKAGKKILATGNGKCNFTNMVQKPECYRSDDSEFAMKVLPLFDVSKTLQFFKELGIYPKERDGYLYPNSEQAASIVQVLLMECRRLKVEIIYDQTVKDILKPNYTVITNQQTYYGKNLILATGGCANPKLGSDGSGYRLAKIFGHTIIKPLPALVQLKSPDKFCKTISGVRTNAKVTAYANNRNKQAGSTVHQTQIAEEEGEILFTDYGISGIVVMQVSRFIAKALDRGLGVHLLLDYLPDVPEEELLKLLHNRVNQNPEKNLEEMLVGVFNHKLSYIIIKEAKLDPYQPCKNITKQNIKMLAKQMKEFKILISDTNSFDQAQVCSGGVSTKEVNENSMESKLSDHLFLAGELVDVDGTCGGYNLQWAWSSGYLAGFSAGSSTRGSGRESK